jgi:hypothetical protein
MDFEWIEFRGERYLLIAKPGEEDGPIATPAQYEHGVCSFAHLHPDGRITRFGDLIGTRDDLTFTGVMHTVRLSDEAIPNMLSSLLGLDDDEED